MDDLRFAQVRQRIEQRDPVACTARDVRRPFAPRQRLLRLVLEGGESTEVPVGDRELAGIAQRLEQRDGLLARGAHPPRIAKRPADEYQEMQNVPRTKRASRT